MAGASPFARLLLLTGCLLLLADAARLPGSLEAEADALLKLKSGIKDDGGALSSWDAVTSPCVNGDFSNWAGVMCNKDGVQGLQLEKMGLSGKLELSSLKNIPGLRSLSFMDNEFAGTMPDVKELRGLRAIFLSGNKFSGQIPADAFAGMGSLRKVVFSKNNFTGPIPASVADMPKLLTLQLNDNKFQGKIPDLPQTELKEVNLANNELDGEIPGSLKSISRDMFAGNKKLCGAPLDAKCEAPSLPSQSPAGTSEKSGAPPSLTEPNAKTSMGASSSADNAAQELLAPTERSSSAGILGAFLVTLAVVSIVFVALQKRREHNTKNFAPAASVTPSTKTEPHRPAANDASTAHVTPRSSGAGDGAGEDRSSRVGGSTVRKAADQGRLTYVRDDRGRFFELQDLLKATAEVLGTANLGVCYRTTLTSGHSVVVKRFKEMNRVGREDFEEHMRRLGRLSHPNLLPLIAYYYRKEEKLLIHDYVPNRSLANLLHGEGRGLKKAVVHWTTRLKIVKGATRALSYLYDELCMLTVPHGHLKSSNVLLDGNFEPLLTDYALVPVMNQSHAAQLMVAFKAPERKQFGRSSKNSDVWCLGLLILEILTGRPVSYDTPPPKPAAGNSDVVSVVSSTPEGEWLDTVVDEDMRNEHDENKKEMVKLIRIGMACCEVDVDSRWELKNAIDRIEELKSKENANEDHSFYSSVNDDD